jgi:glycosyltransferase involved in cell wall biosynthesis
VDVIKRHADGIAYWTSEPDKGLADAWNKGLAKARGGIIGLLNADDLYHPDAVETACRSLREGELALTYGDAAMFTDDPSRPDSVFRGDFKRDFLFNGFGFMHTTCFTTRRVYEEVGGFDTRYRIGVDTDFLLRCIRRGVEFRRIDSVTFMRSGGMSERRRSQAYGEFLAQLCRYGYSKPRIARAWLHYHRRRLFGRRDEPAFPRGMRA